MSVTDSYQDDDHPLGEEFEDEYEPPSDEAPEDDDPGEEERARLAGWRPFAEWNGPPEEWKSAAEFNAVADANAPVLKETNRRLTAQLARTQRQLDEFKRDAQASSTTLMGEIREMGQRLRSADDRAVETLRARLLQERREAVAGGDQDEFDRIEAELAKLPPSGAAARPPPAEPPVVNQPTPAQVVPPDEMAVINAWIADNPWFLADNELKNAMMAMHTTIRRTRPRMALRQQLDLAKKRLMEDMPEAFDEEEPLPEPPPARTAAQTPQRRVAPAVSRPAGGGGGTPPARRSIWDEIPQDERRAAQAAFEHFKRANDDPDMPAREYVTLYNDPKADYLVLRRQRKAK